MTKTNQTALNTKSPDSDEIIQSKEKKLTFMNDVHAPIQITLALVTVSSWSLLGHEDSKAYITVIPLSLLFIHQIYLLLDFKSKNRQNYNNMSSSFRTQIIRSKKVVSRFHTNTAKLVSGILASSSNIDLSAKGQLKYLRKLLYGFMNYTSRLSMLCEKCETSVLTAASIKNISKQSIESLEKQKDTGSELLKITKKLSVINSFIEEIANSTSKCTEIALKSEMLAFNASMEAAADEAGAEFASIAKEMDSLAKKIHEKSATMDKIIETTKKTKASLSEKLNLRAQEEMGRTQIIIDKYVSVADELLLAIDDSESVIKKVTVQRKRGGQLMASLQLLQEATVVLCKDLHQMEQTIKGDSTSNSKEAA